ncbi:MAG: methanogenesis marker 17 protein [Methanobrevibacter ruminantium]|uniref:methanogenesis marker 17 protein n=1 Tax=Methanobrevibacter ruminantium TaxID=83816 RepID=UPI0026E961C2|nr:methanogenesis marker 17 protein [Methanobrevibacter ruminantium]MCI5737423.1 methanogenesis marker 17 protein [Methanobrevibacter ruminantium]MDO5843328.1 methanogenesis marker 17 protein [Methanobrevibacter ruminantium]
MYIESNDPEGAKVYDMIIRQILQDLVLPPSIDDMRAYVNPDEVCFIIAIKMRKTSKQITLKEVAKVNYEADDDTTVVLIDDENYLPNILRTLWKTNGRENVHQPSRYVIHMKGEHEVSDLVVDDPHENLKRRIYDAIFRIVPEGFKIMKDISRDDIVSVIATDELIKDEWVEKAEGYIVELNTPKTWD